MTDQEAIAEARTQLRAAAELAAATSNFFQTTARVNVGATTVHIVGDTAAYERMVKAADRLAHS